MSVKKRKSKKRSDVSSSWQREEPILFLDRNLGKHIIADRLRSAGMKVEVHDNHLPPDAPDEDWLALVGRMGWVALTKDKNIRYRTAELESIRRNAARIIVIRAKNATGSDIAELLVKGRRRIARFVAKTVAPFVAAIDGSSRIRVYLDI
jgi:predicted nuclease of predicted toxin-antitoxin system